MPQLTDTKQYYGRPLTLSEKLHTVTLIVRIPIALIWTCLTSALFRPKYFTFQRAVIHRMIRWANAHIPIPVMQAMTPHSVDSYKRWAKRMKVPITVEDLVEDTSIMWIGPKRLDKVILCVHGGAYISPLNFLTLRFYTYLQKELSKSGREVGIAVLGYTILPDAGFPAQMHQLAIAVQHLFALGLHPSNLHLIGDSAGGNVILSFLSHVLHPLPGIRKLSSTPLPSPIRGAYLLSPWLCMRSTSPSYKCDAPNDILSSANMEHFTDLVLAYASPAYNTEEQMVYLDPINAPSGWFGGLEGVVDRVLTTVGSEELFLDDVVDFSENVLAKTGADVRFVIQDGGVHCDPILDFVLSGNPGKEAIGSLMKVILGWLEEGIAINGNGGGRGLGNGVSVKNGNGTRM